MSRIGKYGNRPAKDALNIGNRAVLAAFFAVAVVPIEAGNGQVH
jgi:hypothetical protein